MPRRVMAATLLPLVVLLVLGGQQLLAKAPPTPDTALIRLKSVTFDPQAGEPALSAVLRAPAASGTSTYLVQFAGPVQEPWKDAARQAGARLYGYIPDNAFIARASADSAAQLRALPFVRWVGVYHPAYRLAPDLAQAPAVGSVRVTAQTLPDADMTALAAQVAGWGGQVERQARNPAAAYLGATLPASRLGDLAARDEVLWVEPYIPPELHNDIGGGQIMRANAVRQSLGLFGAGQTVAVADTGLDVGDAASLHPDIRGRLLKAYCLGRPTPSDWSDHDAHGTHVAGSVLGSGSASGSSPAAHQYAGSHAGVAPEARLVFQSIEDSGGNLNGIPNDEGDLMRQAYADGARIHTNSWGGPTGGTSTSPQYGGYVSTSQMVDQAAWEHKDQLILFSAGNSGTDANGDGVVDPDSIGQPGTAKNVITIGASENLRDSGGYNPGSPACGAWGECWPNDFGAEPLVSDTPSDDANGMAAFSSRGPADDGRIKPELVAPGTNIVSVRSHQADAGTGWGVFDANYIYEGGTSMATPLTAGAAAIAREWLTRIKGIANPSAALMKSVLINGAADMSPGQYGGGDTQEIPGQRPNNVAGWGRVDLKAALDPPAPRGIWLADTTSGLSTGQDATYQVTVSAGQAAGKSVVLIFYVTTDNFSDLSTAWVDDATLSVTTPGGGPTATPTATPTKTAPPPTGSGPLRVTLAWTDYPGEPAAARALVNDLDLEIIAPNGTHYVGNHGLYATGQCLRSGKWDACNNVEGVILAQAAPGTYMIVVHGAQVPQGGKQPFALVASGNGLQQGGQPKRPAAYLPVTLRGAQGLASSADTAPTPVGTPAVIPAQAAGSNKDERLFCQQISSCCTQRVTRRRSISAL